MKQHPGEATLSRLSPKFLVIAGWTGRDPVALEHHIAELEKEGIPRPREVPVFYRVGASLLTHAGAIQVAGPHSSGEVEAFVFKGEDGWWVGAGSDHTDRHLERTSITLSKQVCPKPVASALWPYDEVRDHWGRLVARSWILKDGVREPYQEGTLERNRHPAELVSLYEARHAPIAEGTIMLCGTQSAIGGIRTTADRFEFELEDPVLGRRITHGYDILVLPADA
jgi:hypothetical protein